MTEARQTRGFLFADLRDYSRFTERHGDDAATRLLTRYRAMAREVIGRFDGAEIRTEGDSFYVVFTSVGNAVNAGLAILDGAKTASGQGGEEPIHVGIGIHAGETIDGEQGIVSSAVNIAARVCSVAGPGQLLVTETVRGLVRGYLDVNFTSIGSKKLKGIAEPMALYHVMPSGSAPPHRRAVPRSVSRRWLQRGGVALAAALVIVGAAIIGGTLMREGIAREPPRPAASQLVADEASGRIDASQMTATASDAASYPTAAEAELLDAVGSTDAEQCQRAPEGPIYLSPAGQAAGEPPRRIEVSFAAGIECALGGISAPDVVRYWRLPPGGGTDVNAPDETKLNASVIVHQRAGNNQAVPGACADGAPAVEEWTFGGISGLLVCYETTTGDAVLWWTYDGTHLLATAVRDDRDMSALLEWWTANARFTPRVSTD